MEAEYEESEERMMRLMEERREEGVDTDKKNMKRGDDYTFFREELSYYLFQISLMN